MTCVWSMNQAWVCDLFPAPCYPTVLESSYAEVFNFTIHVQLLAGKSCLEQPLAGKYLAHNLQPTIALLNIRTFTITGALVHEKEISYLWPACILPKISVSKQ
mmetsp:Transcript_6382/g.11369  ORF Transcript_6382/g.11369 Transcript_6382/m.11369 type:complete len:103 (-) Transcript_6382:589-897(-)